MQINESHVLSFRARRGHLAGPGAHSPVEAARAVVGIQAQIESPALWAMAMRTQGRPTAEALLSEIFAARSLVRTWAQRDTLHLYPAQDWPLVAAADPLWPSTSRFGALASEHALAATRVRLADRVVTRAEVFDLVTEAMHAEMAARVGDAQAPRYAAGRLFWQLAHRGEVCQGPMVGAEQGYVARSFWLPDLHFPTHDATEAAIELTRRYLAVNGPASPKDVAHFFGARVTEVRRWFAALSPELVEVVCPGHADLFVLAADTEALRADDAPPPPRLLAGYDTLLMAHADKTWTVPVAGETKAIWRPSAVVAAIVLAGGRAVGVWTQKKTKKAVQISVAPLSQWRPEYLTALEADAQALATHLGLAEATLSVA